MYLGSAYRGEGKNLLMLHCIDVYEFTSVVGDVDDEYESYGCYGCYNGECIFLPLLYHDQALYT
jgi:hypothetical protein